MSGDPAKKVDFFVSYASPDRPWAEWITWQLEQEGYICRMQGWDFGAGRNVIDEIDQAIRESSRTVAVLSQAYLESKWAMSEIRAVLHGDPSGEDQLLLPIRVTECQPTGLLAPISYVDLCGVEDEAVARSLVIRGAQRDVPPRPKVAPPFPGGRPAPVMRRKPPWPGRRSSRRKVIAWLRDSLLGMSPRWAILAAAAALVIVAGAVIALWPSPSDSMGTSLTQVGVSPRSLALGTGPTNRLWIADPTQPEAWWLHDADGGVRTDQAFLTETARPKGVAVDARHGAVWVVDEHNDVVWRVSIDHPRETQAVALGAKTHPQSIAVDGDVAWIANGNGTISRIDTRNDSRFGQPISVGTSLSSIAVGDGGVWVTDPSGGSTWRLDEQSPASLPTQFDSYRPTAVAVGAGAAWVANLDGKVSRIDSTSMSVRPITVVAGHWLCGVAVGDGRVWVSDRSGNQVWSIDPQSGAVADHPVDVEDKPCAIAAGGGSVWVANAGDSSISRFEP